MSPLRHRLDLQEWSRGGPSTPDLDRRRQQSGETSCPATCLSFIHPYHTYVYTYYIYIYILCIHIIYTIYTYYIYNYIIIYIYIHIIYIITYYIYILYISDDIHISDIYLYNCWNCSMYTYLYIIFYTYLYIIICKSCMRVFPTCMPLPKVFMSRPSAHRMKWAMRKHKRRAGTLSSDWVPWHGRLTDARVIHIYIYIYTYIYVSLSLYIHVYICIYIHTHTHKCFKT